MIVTSELANRPIVTSSVVAAGVFLIVLVFGCASNNSASSNPPTAAAAVPAAQATPPPGSVLVASSTAGSSSATAAGATASGAPSMQEHLVGIGSATVVTIHGKIVSVNRAKRLVTLVGPDGKRVTVHAYNPYNLAAAKPGAPFVAKFYEIVTVRKKRPGESLPAASLAEGVVSAVRGQIPGAVAGTSVRLVVTVDARHRGPRRRLLFRGGRSGHHRGRYLDCPVRKRHRAARHHRSCRPRSRRSPRRPHYDVAELAKLRKHFIGVYAELKQFTSTNNEKVDSDILEFQVPGGMLSNFRSQLKEQGMADRFDEGDARNDVCPRGARLDSAGHADLADRRHPGDVQREIWPLENVLAARHGCGA